MAEQQDTLPASGGPSEGRAARDGSRVQRPASSIGGVAVTLIAVVFSSQLHVSLGYALFTEQALAAILGFALAMILIRVPARCVDRRAPGRGRVPWYDLALAALARSVYDLVPISRSIRWRCSACR